MGAKVVIFDKILNSTFLKGLRHSALVLTKKPIHPTMEMYTCTIWTGTFGTVDYVGNICTIFCSWLLASLPLYLAIGTCGGIFNYWDFLHYFQLIATADIFGTFFNCCVATTGNILGKFLRYFEINGSNILKN